MGATEESEQRWLCWMLPQDHSWLSTSCWNCLFSGEDWKKRWKNVLGKLKIDTYQLIIIWICCIFLLDISCIMLQRNLTWKYLSEWLQIMILQYKSNLHIFHYIILISLKISSFCKSRIKHYSPIFCSMFGKKSFFFQSLMSSFHVSRITWLGKLKICIHCGCATYFLGRNESLGSSVHLINFVKILWCFSRRWRILGRTRCLSLLRWRYRSTSPSMTFVSNFLTWNISI